MKIQGQAALVTGAGSGLGEATARELARLGAKVAVLDVNLDNARRVAADIGAQYGKGCAAPSREASPPKRCQDSRYPRRHIQTLNLV